MNRKMRQGQSLSGRKMTFYSASTMTSVMCEKKRIGSSDISTTINEEFRRDFFLSLVQADDYRGSRAQQIRSVRVFAVNSLISEDIVFYCEMSGKIFFQRNVSLDRPERWPNLVGECTQALLKKERKKAEENADLTSHLLPMIRLIGEIREKKTRSLKRTRLFTINRQMSKLPHWRW